jgi:uncharacterized protein with NRDE domain
MCTLIVIHRVWEDAPLVVAVNRDEEYDRPSSPPCWDEGVPSVLSPLDERAGGTWMGANTEGLWVGITNRSEGEADPGRRSRGLLCRDLLREPRAEAVAERLSRETEPYNPFHIVAADHEAIFWIEQADGETRLRSLSPGCHVVTNRPYGAVSSEAKTVRVQELLREAGLPSIDPEGFKRPVGPLSTGINERLTGLLADHGREGRDAICLHGGGYGTRSSAVWTIGSASGRSARIGLRFADGPPCTTPFDPVAPEGPE